MDHPNQSTPPELLPCGCKIAPNDPLKSSVFWNPYNKVVQCHQCGEVYDARASSPAQAEWMPIESAPRGIHILIYCKRWRQKVREDVLSDRVNLLETWLNEGAPTHWMPLPAPPKETSK